MADWQRRINLYDDMERCRAGEITVQQLAEAVARKLSALPVFPGHPTINEERDDIVWELNDLASDETATVADFDGILDRLFDWGDTPLDENTLRGKKVCWINVAFARA